MQSIVAAALFSLLLAPTITYAQPVPPAAVSRATSTDTIALQISASGTAHTPADTISLFMRIVGSGESDVAAQKQGKAKAEQVRAALIAQGVDASAITGPGELGRIGFVGNEAFDPDDMPAIAGASATMPRRNKATFVLQIRLTRPDMLPDVRRIITDLGVQASAPPLAELNDDRAARHAAIMAAVRTARADADAYAEAIGYRVVRITQMSNRAPAENGAEDLSTMIRLINPSQPNEVRGVETKAVVTVSFLLAPR